MFRSCQFRHLCLDTSRHMTNSAGGGGASTNSLPEWVLIRSPTESKLHELLTAHEQQAAQTNHRPGDSSATISSLLHMERSKVSLGTLRQATRVDPTIYGADPAAAMDGENEELVVKEEWPWFPRVVVDSTTDEVTGGFELLEPADAMVLVPFRPYGRDSFWNDFLPIFTLLTTFGLDDKKKVLPILMSDNDNQHPLHHHALPLFDQLEEEAEDPEGKESFGVLCEDEPTKARQKDCFATLQQIILPGMGIVTSALAKDVSGLVSLTDLVTQSRQRLVCAKYGAAGIGAIFDQGGVRQHLQQHHPDTTCWAQDDCKMTHTIGRGAILWSFRKYLAPNLLIKNHVVAASKPIVTFFIVPATTELAEDEAEAAAVERYYAYVRQAFPKVLLEEYRTGIDNPIDEHALIASETSILVMHCSDNPVKALFLPRDASLLLLCGPRSGRTRDEILAASRVGWSLLANAGYIRVDALPIHPSPDDFVEAVRRELDWFAANVESSSSVSATK